MRKWNACLSVSAAIAVWLALVAPAHAQGTDQAATAEALFDEGLKLLDAGKIAEACPKLEASYRIEPGYGVLFNLADCHEQSGRTASAWAEFREAIAMAKKSGEAEREKKAARRSEALEPRLVRLLVAVKDKTEGLRVTRDDAPLDQAIWGNAVPVDPGPHTLKATAPGKKAWTITVEVAGEGNVVSVEVPALAEEIKSPAPAPPSRTSEALFRKPTPVPDAARGGLSMQRTVALLSGGIGVAGIMVGTIFGIRAKSRWKDALTTHCNDEYQCDDEGLRLGKDATTAAHVSTATLIVGGAAVAGAAVLWFTAPRRSTPAKTASVQVAPVVGVSSGGLLVGGRF